MGSLVKKRRRKMSRHKYRKRRKANRHKNKK
ncbi:MAG: AURKAIP1/COX24 domain-containing protein [bacterium]|nr:AURKAIP1/COX24 domain-containing protein [bacterium]MXX01380.1 AURKAIP1/COX24 domain-containing protein [Acidimicrobiia bacterium]MDE0120841.1 AURKAIP1/COX24 domain-containing protein [bacterium]MDE0132524.1 AURKAIP1/COX24 domain-containing protein [bacterium]MDE0187689.1 AURKAIP1/COX24 domain-containing protein [bacterium]